MGSWKVVGIFILFLAAGALAAGLASSWYNTLPSPGEKPVEVREYRGEMLSSIDDFRENSIKGPQYLREDQYRLSVRGLVSKPANYTYKEIMELFPHEKRVVTLFCVEGWDVTILWEGVPVREILARSDPDPAADALIFHAADGYSTSLPLSYVVSRDLILAYSMNNVTLPAERGFPFQLVAEDKWGYKWIKWVTTIEVARESGYRGYWEMRGFSNNGSISLPFYS
jgi:DMSO/TMAO reductase YedYZ molybdopterin-dependent catalytic subunit